MRMFAAPYTASMAGRVMTAQPMQPAPPAPAPQKPSFFGHGGAGRNIAGHIGDTLLQMNNAGSIFAPAMQEQKRQLQAAQLLEQRRQQENDDWMAREQWKRENASPPAPSDFERTLLAAGYQPGTDEWTNLMRHRALNIANPVQGVRVTNQDGSEGIQFIRPGSLGTGASQQDDDEWEYEGGAGPSGGPRTFP